MTKEQVKELLFEAFLKAHQYFSKQDTVDTDEPLTPIELDVPLTPVEPTKLTVNVEDYDSPQEAVDYIALKGGGRIVFSTADIGGNIKVSTPNIELYTTVGTILRPTTSANTISIEAGGTGFILDGMHVSGQTLANEAMGASDGRINTTALHCISILEAGAILRNFRAEGASVDNLYINHTGAVNLHVENFFLGGCARNPLTWIEGYGGKFINGTIHMSDYYGSKRDGGTTFKTGYVMVDFEPNIKSEHYGDVAFNNVKFINEGTAYGAHTIVLQDPDDTGVNNFNISFVDCELKSLNGAKSPLFRLKLDYGVNTCEGLTFKNVTCESRLLSVSERKTITLKNSTFENVQIGHGALTWAVELSDGCVVDNLTSTVSDEVYIQKANGADVVVTNTIER